jgi:phage tail-like protein
MDKAAIRYWVLRDPHQWDAATGLSHLTARADGALQLCHVPGIEGNPIQLPEPYAVALSGIAVDAHDTAYWTLPDSDALIRSVCAGHDEALTSVGGTDRAIRLNRPRGLLIRENRLWLTDRGGMQDTGRIIALDLPSLRVHTVWEHDLQNPVALAADKRGRIYVLDADQHKVMRFSATGAIDTGFALAAGRPAAIAIDDQDRLYVADADSNTVSSFDVTVSPAKSLHSIQPQVAVFKPRALTVHGPRLYVADAHSGYIWVYDSADSSWLGRLHSYRGPVSALAADRHGSLWIKPDAGETVHRLTADAAHVATGVLRAGWCDAGEGEHWERVWVTAEIPLATTVTLQVAGSDSDSEPDDDAFTESPALDVLLRTLVDKTGKPLSPARYLWLRITLNSLDGRSTPALLQVQAATPIPSYMDHLPAIYRREDAKTGGFLENWLALFRAELGDWEQRMLEDLPRQFDARTADATQLTQLAGWLGLDLPAKLDAAEQRRLLTDAMTLYRQRGTPAGLHAWVKRHLGVTIHLFEAFHERQVWRLNEAHSKGLGLDTWLAAGLADGFIVPGFTYVDRALSGLRGEYYEGINFEIFRYSRIDERIDFAWGADSPLKGVAGQEAFPADIFSVRWRGQIRPRFDETYTFRTNSDDGIRLWIGGRLIIDNWTDHSPTVDAGQIRLEAERWYPMVLEYYEKGGAATISLSWSSASQRSEIVPQECLYSLLDETVDFAPEDSKDCALIEVGQVVVGESRPLAAEHYGAPLADDYAHLFTVMAYAAQVPLETQRRALREMIEAEKPAYTDFNFCLIEPRMRVGIQARVGIDSVVAGPGPAMRLESNALGYESYLGGEG